MAGMPPQQSFPRHEPVRAPAGTNGMAVASLVLGLISIFTCFLFVPGALAVIFGVIGLVQGGSSNRSGRGMAVAGIATGALSLALLILGVFALFMIPEATVTAGDAVSSETLAKLRALEWIEEDDVPVMVVGGGWMDWVEQGVVLLDDELVSVAIEHGKERIRLEDVEEIDLDYTGSGMAFDLSTVRVETGEYSHDLELPSGGGDIRFLETLKARWRAVREAAGRPVVDDLPDAESEDDSTEDGESAGMAPFNRPA